MKYGQDLIDQIEKEITAIKAAQANRAQRIADWETDEDDCFISARHDDQSLAVCYDKIELLKNGGCEWFVEYATLSGELVNAHWCNTRYGDKLRAEMPDGTVVWTTATTAKGLAKVGLKKVECFRPAWFAFKGNGSGMWGVYTGSYQVFPSDTNYATGEAASAEPLEIREYKG